MDDAQQPYVTIRARKPGSVSSADSTAGDSASGEYAVPPATHDTGRTSYHVKHIDSFAKTLEDSATRAFPNRGRSSQQRYKKVQALLLHWKLDDLFVLPELEDLEGILREGYSFETDIFAIPSENAHLELMLKVGAMIKEHESNDTLFVVYYGGHAKIDDSRQSTWCATRHPASPWLQWSAIQTLLERSLSDTLILLDCCAGAASATFPSGKSITETISASSWDSIAPDPGRYSFTNAVIEVLDQWRRRTFSAAMLHAEVLARLKHPRPITINGKHFEARSTPVHFMMTSNHKAPSIELGRILPKDRMPPSPPQEPEAPEPLPTSGRGPFDGAGIAAEPNEDQPHVMISLALEDDQRLDLNAWEQWLSTFPALAKYVKVQGVFKSHSTLLLLSMPVMVWDLLPEDHACSFVAFIRSNNLIKETQEAQPALVESATQTIPGPEEPEEDDDDDGSSVFSGTTMTPTEQRVSSILRSSSTASSAYRPAAHRVPPQQSGMAAPERVGYQRTRTDPLSSQSYDPPSSPLASQRSATNLSMNLTRQFSGAGSSSALSARIDNRPEGNITRTVIMNQQRSSRRTISDHNADVPEGPAFAQHIVDRLEEYFQNDPTPNDAFADFFASNLGVEKRDVDLWFLRRRQDQRATDNLQNLRIADQLPEVLEGPKMILPGHLNTLLEIFPQNQVLLIDVRSVSDFEKSHIHGAAHLRVPTALVSSHFDLIDHAFTDEHSRRNFARWRAARCLVVYDRAVELPHELPLAAALLAQLRARAWAGPVCVLKGHYHEFARSFDRYVTGDRMTQAAQTYRDSLRARAPLAPAELQDQDARFAEWLRRLEGEERVVPALLTRERMAERLRDVEQRQRELEAELEARNPALRGKIRDLGPAAADPGIHPLVTSEPTAGKFHLHDAEGVVAGYGYTPGYAKAEPLAGLVGPLSRGLDKVREAGGSGSHGGEASAHPDKFAASPPYYDKLASSEEFDEIDPRDEQFRNDPGFPKAGDLLGGGDDKKMVGGGTVGRERPFWKRLRSANK